MKFLSLIAIGLSLTSVSLAQKKQNIIETQRENVIRTRPESELAVPTSLLTAGMIGIFAETAALLAPQSGTEMAFSANHFQFKSESKGSSYKGSGTLNNNTGMLYLAHAFNPNFFVGANIGYTQGENTFTNTKLSTGDQSSSNGKTTGFSDPTLNIGGRIDSASGSALLGLSANLSSESSEYESKRIDDNHSESQSDSRRGGVGITPSIAIFTNSPEKMIIGTKLAYTIMQERTSVSKNIGEWGTSKRTEKTTDGNIQNLSAFIESPDAQMSFGGAISYYKNESSTVKTENSKYENSAISLTSLSGFVKFKITKDFSLIPNASISKFNEGLSDNSEIKDIYSVGIFGKTTF